jgi:hypothetical protein
MKKLFFAAAVLWASAGCFAQDKKEVLAVPDQERGYYTFFNSNPAHSFETLGHETIKLVLLSSSECKNRIFKRAAEYPEANGLKFYDLNYCEADILKIKVPE